MVDVKSEEFKHDCTKSAAMIKEVFRRTGGEANLTIYLLSGMVSELLRDTPDGFTTQRFLSLLDSTIEYLGDCKDVSEMIAGGRYFQND